MDVEQRAIADHFRTRRVPAKRAGRLLLGTWNIANLGAQSRTPSALRLLARIASRFELLAIQEVNEEFRSFEGLVRLMGDEYDYVMSDTAGNEERLAFVYDTRKVSPRNLFGELALRPREYPRRTVRVRYRSGRQDRTQTFRNLRFVPFDRNPYIGSFSAGAVDFTLANVHLYFGSFQNSSREAERRKYARRVLEIFALSRWADRRVDRRATYDRDIILLGDMNVPAMDPSESTYAALVEFGFQPVQYPSQVGGSNLGNDKTYDQMAFAPGAIARRIRGRGVFDFDNAVFAGLWNRLASANTHANAIRIFRGHVRHHLSDHRPLWVDLDIS